MQESIGGRLKALRAEATQEQFAITIGVVKNTIARYERDERTPDSAFLQKLFELGYNPTWVLTGQGSMHGGIVDVEEPDTSRIKHTAPAEANDGEFVRIKRYGARLAAGNGQIGEDSEAVDWLQFRRQYLDFIGLSPKNAAIVRIKGDSMEPMLIDGDTVMIDLTDTTICPPARSFDRRRAYAIKRIGGETALLQCKFVELVRADGAEFTQVSSFNDQYACERVGEGNEIQVIGRIRWHGHTWF